jgi:hypothetical protein
MFPRVFAILGTLVQCSDSFNLVMSPFTVPAYGQNPNPDGSLLAKKSNTIGGTLKPSDTYQNYAVFGQFIINQNLDEISELNAERNFQAPTPSIFRPTDPEFYTSESQFGVALFHQRLRPMLEHAQVFFLMNCLISYLIQLLSLTSALQIDLGCCVCDAAKAFQDDLRARLTADEILPHCSLPISYFDVSLTANAMRVKSSRKIREINRLLGIFELKNIITEMEVSDVVCQTIVYMVSALAYSRWGVLQNCSPLVALIVASNCVYRLTSSRTTAEAMGFMMKIEKAKDVAAMEWILFDYVQSYISDYRITASVSFDSKPPAVDPFSWSPLNFGSSDWIPVSEEYNFGLLFRTTSDEVIRVVEKYRLEWLFGTLSPGTNVIVKHVNAVLDVDFASGVESINFLLLRDEADASRAEIDVFRVMLAMPEDERKDLLPPPPKSQSNSLPTGPPASVKNPSGIRHPYLAIADGLSGPLFVMEDVGTPLSQVMQSPQFRQRWAQSAGLRGAFLSDVGLSALNLVERLHRCHNDIRPPNIAFDFSSDRFCLIDFDFSRANILTNSLSAFSPNLRTIYCLKNQNKLRVFSVAQITLTVFMLSGPNVVDLGAVTKATSIWDQKRGASKIDAEFERWVQGKGGRVLEFVAACRGATEWPPALISNGKAYLSSVLSEMLQ